MLSRISAAHALSGTASIALAALAAICILGGHHWPAAAVGGVGVGSLAIVMAYALAVRMVYYDQRLSAQLAASQHEATLVGEHKRALTTAIIGFCLAAAAIVGAGPFMAEAAGTLAELSGLGGTFVGSTLVAFSTSLPELVATFTALRIGAFDLAIGNIYGSNAFNILLLVPLDLTSAEPLYSVVSSTHAVTCLCAVVITSVAVMGQLYQVERRVRFLEPDAMLVIALVIASLGLIYLLR